MFMLKKLNAMLYFWHRNERRYCNQITEKNYHSKAFELLKKLNPKKQNFMNISIFWILTDTGTNYNFPIHNDTPNK